MGPAGIMDASEMVDWLSRIVHERGSIEAQAAAMLSLGIIRNHAYTMQKSCLE